MTGAEWLAVNERQVRALARKLHRRWSLPAGVGVEDLEQEVRMGALVALSAYDPSRGMDLDRYVWISASQAAREWMHRQRSARGRRGKAPSRHAIAESVIDVPLDSWEAEGAADAAEFLDAVRSALAQMRTGRERASLAALIGAGLDRDEAAREMVRTGAVSSPRAARRSMRRCIDILMEVGA